jgi:L-seryl-tRNA(Ser) seleniumtransferase
MFRALRVDKLTYAALEATLLAYVRGDRDAIPALHMMRMPKDEIRRRAESLREKLKSPGIMISLQEGDSVVGGGAAPSAVLPTIVVALSVANRTADELASRLRLSNPPVIVRIEDGQVLIDLRTVLPEQDEILLGAVQSVASQM